jgi:hypothetical protein
VDVRQLGQVRHCAGIGTGERLQPDRTGREGQGLRHAGRLNAGDLRHFVAHPGVEGGEARTVAISGARGRVGEGHAPVDAEPGIHTLESHETANEQRGPGNQGEGQRHLRNHRSVAQAAASGGGRGPAGAAAEGGGQVECYAAKGR